MWYNLVVADLGSIHDMIAYYKHELSEAKRVKQRTKMGYHAGFPMGYPFRVR